ncbi:hypothetical protein QUA35_01835 [Microcoleus sp. N9_B2]|uniref:hypothetical protein n=1 Tax=unclassified Microcoleus TaxID=2642155 RepID=UPI002FD67DDD
MLVFCGELAIVFEGFANGRSEVINDNFSVWENTENARSNLFRRVSGEVESHSGGVRLQ